MKAEQEGKSIPSLLCFHAGKAPKGVAASEEDVKC